MATAATELVGRTQELGLLERLLDEVGAGSARFVAISGEPGIGKTTLLGELTPQANDRDFLVLEARAAEFERGVPYALLHTAFDGYLRSLKAPTIERLAGDDLTELAAIFPSLRDLVAGAAPTSTPAERFRTNRAVAALIDGLASVHPLLLALDDVHWADAASLGLTEHLLRRPPEAPVLVAVAMRERQAPPGVVSKVEAAARQGAITRIELGPLDSSDAERMIELADPAERERIYAASGGNPFYLEQLARAPRPDGRPATTVAGVPGAVAAANQGEVEGLGVDGLALARAAAVVGDPFEIEVAARVAELADEASFTALDELVERGLVRTTQAPRQFRFRHPLVHQAIYERLTPGRRLAAHGRAADVLATTGTPPTTRAHHVEASAAKGDRGAVELLRSAGESAAQRDPAAAARWYGSALRLLGDDAGEERLGLIIAHGSSLAAAGRISEAIGKFESALASLPPEPSGPRLGLSIGCASLELLVGRLDTAKDRLGEALDGVPDCSPGRARLLVHLGTIAMYAADYREMDRCATAAIEAAGGGGGPMMSAWALRAFAACQLGEVERARSNRDLAAEELSRLADAELAEDLNGVALLGSASHFLDRNRDALAEAHRGMSAAQALGQGQWLLPTLFIEALAQLSLGEIEAATSVLDDLIDAAWLADDPQGLMWGLAWRGRAAYLSGDLEGALEACEQSLELTGSFGHLHLSSWMAANLAEALLETGEAPRARELVLEHGGGEELPLAPATTRPRCYALLAETSTALSDAKEAVSWVERAEACAERYGLPLPAAEAAHARATVLAAGGDHRAAAAVALAAVEAADEAGGAIEVARLRIAAGRSLGAAGDRPAALAQLEAAEERSAACGAARLRAEATRELRKLGRRTGPRRRSAADATGLEALSARELEIATLVRRRRTNPQIAAELYLSPKTVESHLRNIFRKLDVSSRVEVAELIEGAERA